MSLFSFSNRKFRGLNIEDPELAGPDEAINMLNADVTRGDLRPRQGSVQINDVTLATAGYQSLNTLGGNLYAARRDSSDDFRLDLLNNYDVEAQTASLSNIGSVAKTGTWDVQSVAALGTASASFVYYSLAEVNTTAHTPIKFNVTAGTLALAAGLGQPMYVATWGPSNRLVQGNYLAAANSPSGANGSKSTVFFSNQGDPDTYGANNFVTLQPGDGEYITAIVGWRELVFVIKNTNMFVFYGENTDDEGNTKFIYRRVALPRAVNGADITASLTAARVAVAAEDGVYLSTVDGIYRTTGGEPVLVSKAIRGAYSREPFIPSLTTDAESLRIKNDIASAGVTVGPSLSVAGRWLVVSYVNSGDLRRQYVMDFVTGEWMNWALPSTIDWMVGSAAYPDEFFFASGNNIYLSAPNLIADGGTPISWFYDSGFHDFGSSNMKRIRFTDLYGSGTVSSRIIARGARYDAAADPGDDVLLGTAPAIERRRRRLAARGREFSWRISGGTSDGGSVNRIDHYYTKSERET